MKLIRGTKNLKPRRFNNPVAAIGIFDGVHIGHKKILSALTKRAARLKGTGIVITFDPHPAKILRPAKPTPLLMSLDHRIRLIEKSGADALLLVRFSVRFAGMTAREFVESILVKKIGIKELVVGSGFAFGNNKLGGVSFLKKLSRVYGFKIIEIPTAKKGAAPVSSTRIRRLIISGKLDEASKLLARPVSILGTVKHGAKRGRILGIPTANIDPHHEAVPPSGVYAVLVKRKNKTYGGVLNIGRRPTFYKETEPTIEVHLFNFKKSIYKEELELEFVNKLREEKKFASRRDLVKQIKLDESKAKKGLKAMLQT